MAVSAMLLFLACISLACGGGHSQGAFPGGSTHGPELLRQYGCVSCHRIPGVSGADADVGPPLHRVKYRSYLAGRVTNTPANMYRWIRNPQAVDERTAMPNTGVTDRDARAIVSYLYAVD